MTSAPNVRLLAALYLSLLGACNDGSGAPDLAPGSFDLSGPAVDLAGQDLATTLPPSPLGCIENKSYCSAYNERSYCEDTPTGAVWKQQTCATGCYAGVCSTTDCADECTLGVQSNLGLCRLWSLASGTWVAPDQQKLLDRAREHDRVTKEITRPALGAMLSPHYAEPTHATLQYFDGARDAALWSGSYLAAQGWRLLATGARDAADEVATKTRMLHDWFKITGDAGYLARLATPRDAAVPLEYNWQGQSYCNAVDMHCNVDFKGAKWDWLGGGSRDQYAGVMLGLMMAYLSSPDEEVRKLAREDVVTVALELMKTRSLAVNLVLDGIPTSNNVTLQNVLLAPSEYENGKVTIRLSSANLGGLEDEDARGLREFLPDLSALIQQVLPAATAARPRPAIAMMLGGFFAIALRASKDVPGYETAHQQIQSYYSSHLQAWLAIAALWSYAGGCDAPYAPNHMAYIMAYAWAVLEENPVERSHVAEGVLGDRLWAALQTHKNSYFAYLWAGTRTSTPTAAVVAAANLQLEGFPQAPKGAPVIDHLADYEQDSCMVGGYATSKLAVDVADRQMDDFIWQRGAWILRAAGDANQLFPATDYLAAYWAARRHDLIADDRVGTCARWAP